MKNSYLPFLTGFLLMAIGCRSKTSPTASENNIDAARNFIRAALDGRFEEARTYMLTDSINMNYMDVAERGYQRSDQATKNGYRSANIHIHQVTPLNDSVSVVIYSNSFKNDHDTLKVIRSNNQWLVDLKYLYLHDTDSATQQPPAGKMPQ